MEGLAHSNDSLVYASPYCVNLLKLDSSIDVRRSSLKEGSTATRCCTQQPIDRMLLYSQVICRANRLLLSMEIHKNPVEAPPGESRKEKKERRFPFFSLKFPLFFLSSIDLLCTAVWTQILRTTTVEREGPPANRNRPSCAAAHVLEHI